MLQLGVYVVSLVSGAAGEQLMPHLCHLLTLFSSTLEDTTSAVCFHTIQALTNFAPLVDQDNMTEFQALLPKVLVAIKALLTQDQDQAAEGMELFDVLAECEVINTVLHSLPWWHCYSETNMYGPRFLSIGFSMITTDTKFIIEFSYFDHVIMSPNSWKKAVTSHVCISVPFIQILKHSL